MIKLINGDCIEVMRRIKSGSIDAIICDPPYGITNCRWDSCIDLVQMWEEINRILKNNGAAVIMCCQPFTSSLITSNKKQFKYLWYWNKSLPTGFLNSKKQPLRCIEDIAIFYNKQCTYNPQKTYGHKPTNISYKCASETIGKVKESYKKGGNTYRYPNNLLNFKSIRNDGSGDEIRYHPTQKPIQLIEYLVKTYTNESDTVLDFAMGSGTTGSACKNLQRNFIGIELDESYFKIAKHRVSDS